MPRAQARGRGRASGRNTNQGASAPWFETSHFEFFLKSLILAQNERWRRGLGMQVERESRKVSTAA